MQTTFQVEGMHCKNCENKVKTFVSEIQGVQNIQVNLAQKTIEVQYEEPANTQTIVESLQDLGYSAQPL